MDPTETDRLSTERSKRVPKNRLQKDDVEYADRANRFVADSLSGCLPKFLRLLEELYILFIRPLLIVFASFFFGADHKLSFWKPVYDVFGIFLNPVATILELILPITVGLIYNGTKNFNFLFLYSIFLLLNFVSNFLLL